MESNEFKCASCQGVFKGGTATALKIARTHGIPSYWLKGPEALEHVALLARDSARK
jgi:hypothetical protein